MNSLGRVAIVTGAGSGVGRASALALLRDGYSVALAGRRIETLEASIGEAEEHSERAVAVATDVGNPESVSELFARAQGSLRRAAGRAVQQRGQRLPPGQHGRPDL